MSPFIEIDSEEDKEDTIKHMEELMHDGSLGERRFVYLLNKEKKDKKIEEEVVPKMDEDYDTKQESTENNKDEDYDTEVEPLEEEDK